MTSAAAKPAVLLVDMMSGSNDYGRELVASLAPRCMLTVMTVDDSPVSSMPGLRCLAAFPAFGGRGSKAQKLLQSTRAFALLVRELWRHRHHAVHVQFFRFRLADMLIYLACMPWLHCFVYTAHNTLPHESRWWHRLAYRQWYRRVSAVHVLSTHAREGVVALAGIPPEKVYMVPHGNYQSLRARTAAAPVRTPAALGVPPGHRVGLVFGLVREYKGIDRLVQAAALLAPDVPLTLLVAGGGSAELFEQYVQQAKALGVSHRFVFRRGYVPDDELAGLLRCCDFAVFPYRNIYQSGALMLAMTFGVPMVTADLPGFKEYVAEGQQALMCDCANPAALAQTLEKMTRNDDLRRTMGVKARELADTRYDWGAIADELLHIYRQAVR